jgi:hypothetical protein
MQSTTTTTTATTQQHIINVDKNNSNELKYEINNQLSIRIWLSALVVVVVVTVVAPIFHILQKLLR